MELPLSEKLQLRRLVLQSARELGAGFNRGDASATQFELAGQTGPEDVQVPTIRENRIHSHVTANSMHDITDRQYVTAVPATDK